MRRTHTRAKNVSNASLGVLSMAAAYGLRKLSSDYVGPALRVRRSSDNVEADIGFTSAGDLDIFALMNHVGAENLLKNSEQFDSVWGLGTSGSVIANNTIAPDGNLTADAYIFATSTGSYAYLNQTITGDASIALTYSLWMKVPSGTANINLAISNTSVSTKTSPAKQVTTTWQRFVFSIAAADLVNTGNVGVGLLGGTPGQEYHVWGAQLNTGPTVKDYCRTTTTATVDGSGFVSAFYDQSGNVRTMTQATAANQPRIVNAGVIDRIGTHPAISTDGVAQYLATTSFVIPTPFTRAGVLQFISGPGAAQKYYVSKISAPDVNEALTVAGAFTMNSLSAINVATGIVANTKGSFVNIYNSLTSSGSFNGVVTQGSLSANRALDGVKIGVTASGTVFGDALFGEIIIYGGALSDAQRLPLEATQKSYWGL